jgi:uncharacterized membrane protein YfcA
MDYLVLAAIGVVMGFFGGLLGIGGSVIMIPALVFAFGESQHLYQAAAMICNFFVGASATIVHKSEKVLMGDVLKWLIPAAALGKVIGVAISNNSFFAGDNSYLLARILGGFMIYVVVYNCLKFGGSDGGVDGFDITGVRRSAGRTIACGLLSGIPAGLLGLGGGILLIPAQQLFLRLPLKRAISNSAAAVALTAILAAVYKTATLPQHGVAVVGALKISAVVIPGAIVGAFLGGRGVHRLPSKVVRVVFIVLMGLACYKLLTVSPGV